MFDFLKKKIGGFIDGLTKKEEAKEGLQEPIEAPKPKEAEVPAEPKPAKQKPEPARPKRAEGKPAGPVPEKAAVAEPEKKPLKEAREKKTAKPVPAKEPADEPKRLEPQAEEAAEKGTETPEPVPPDRPKERMKLGIIGKVKSAITREVEISEDDVKGMLDSLELELLEADVDMEVAGGIAGELRGKLVGSRIPKGKLHQFISSSIKDTLTDVLSNENSFDIVERAEASEGPLKIMFIGLNGTGKTTTIAKVARLLMDSGKKVVFAAADTFRAAAIEQMSVHAERLGVRVIKREYGSDPTSVAYDAVNYAKAHGLDAVLIDTAGRQDTNVSLINEMKKMRRVIEPDITIYVGESISGNAMIEQVSSFNREVGVDAVILTKLDCDPKGGTMLSISKATGIPIIYIGTGQKYGDLERFDPAAMAARIVE